MKYKLTKTSYCLGLQCPLLLYTKVNHPEEMPEQTPFDEFIFAQGNAVGDLATREFPGGVMIPYKPWSKTIERTRKAMEEGSPAIYEATFLYNDVLVRVDILEKVEDGYNIIEVKQSSKMKDEYIPDVAVQRYVLEGCGIKVNKCFLMHLNKEYVHPEGDLFELEDVTEKIMEHMEGIDDRIAEMKKILKDPDPPSVDIGPHCFKPRECDLKEKCWVKIPDLSIFNIPRNGKKWEMYENGIISLDDIPGTMTFTENQERFLEAFRRKEPVIDMNGIRKMFDKLETPIYFLDFEAINWAVPRFNGAKVYQNIPFQWSLHKLENGKLTHSEFLWDNEKDPRKELLEKLLDSLGEKGSIMVYSDYEKNILKHLANTFPERRKQIENVLERLWDLLIIFKKFYTDHRFKGSSSIKKVLPVLVPRLDYSDLEIQEGGMAMVAFDKMIGSDNKEKMRKDLLKYCERDTMAMVDIYREIKKVIPDQE